MEKFRKLLESLIYGNEAQYQHEPSDWIRLLTLDTGSDKSKRYPSSTVMPREIKVIEVLINEATGPMPIANYLSQVGNLVFTQRDSDMIYGGNDYLRARQDNVVITIVSTHGLWEIPWRFRGRGWMYVSINCAPDDTRFDRFPGYAAIPAERYKM